MNIIVTITSVGEIHALLQSIEPANLKFLSRTDLIMKIITRQIITEEATPAPTAISVVLSEPLLYSEM